MESREVFERKARLAFRFCDENGDGILTVEDNVRFAERFISISKAPSSRAEGIRTLWKKIAEGALPGGGLTEDEYVERGWKMGDNPDWLSKARNVNTDIFHSLDINNDGFISLDELYIYYKTFRCENMTFVKNVFKALDKDGDGRISETEFVNAFTEYWNRSPVYEYLFNPSDESMKSPN